MHTEEDELYIYGWIIRAYSSIKDVIKGFSKMELIQEEVNYKKVNLNSGFICLYFSFFFYFLFSLYINKLYTVFILDNDIM